jgi:hypothetical protein
MTLEEWVAKGWEEHAEDAAAVMARMEEGIGLVTEPKHVGPLSGLLLHVAGEHLGKHDEGLALLDRLERRPAVAAGSAEARAIARSKATLHLARGDRASAETMLARASAGSAFPAASDRVRAFAVAGSTLAAAGRVAEGGALLEEAIAAASYGPTKEDPAARALAITGNNLACELEKKATRTPAETEVMLRAAAVGRRWWEVAGTRVEVGRAEYRLAMSSLAAGRASDAVRHAEAALDAAGDDPADAFGGHDALARARLAGGDAPGARREREEAASCLARIDDPATRAYCAADLAALDAVLSSAADAAAGPRVSSR